MTDHVRYTYVLKDVMKHHYGHGIVVEDLWAYVADKKVETYAMKDVLHWVYHPCWSYPCEGADCYYSIYQVLMQRSKFQKDMRRIKKADTSYPIIVVEDEYDRFGSILDGNHRFAKLVLNASQTVKFVYVSARELNKLRE